MRLSCSNRQARQWLAAGRVRLDEQIVVDRTEPITKFTQVHWRDEHNEWQALQTRQSHYLMLHKPAGVVSATRDPQHRTVIDLLDEPYANELHIAGRLDATSTGLLLLTNDGQWSKRIMAATHKMPKTYWVETEQIITPETITIFAEGMHFMPEDIMTLPAALTIEDERHARLVLYEGRYHQIRRMFARVGNRVTKLHREKIGRLSLGELPEGQYISINPDDL